MVLKMRRPILTGPKVLLHMTLWTMVSLVVLSVGFGPRFSTWLLPMGFGKSVELPRLSLTHAVMEDHPIKTLVLNAGVMFNETLARQSRTFEMAVSEYLRRYQRRPPPGFETWYNYAVKHDSPIIDEFDVINKTLAPFWKLSGLEMTNRLESVGKSGPWLSRCEASNTGLEAGCAFLGSELLSLLSNTEDIPHMPEVDMLLNMLDEPRILPNHDCRDECVEDRTKNSMLVWTDLSHQDVWNEITAGCCVRNESTTLTPSPKDIPFEEGALGLLDIDGNVVDLCHHPEFHDMHGLWKSPTTLSSVNSIVPILSPAVVSTMSDIPLPAAAYSNKAFTYEESEDVVWSDKTASLYWAGKTTGSFQGATDEEWKHSHRQRFVALANGLERKTHTYLWRPNSASRWQKHYSSFLNQSHYNVHFTDVVQSADQATEDAIREYFHIVDPEPREEAFKYTLTFDLDGNGHSGRYYRFLNSRSLPLKQTVFREWHDERLLPWRHYVPISLAMDELPEVVRYLTVEDEGKEIAALLADEGRQWSLRSLRPVDQAIFLYRLMLELSRLQDPSRLADP